MASSNTEGLSKCCLTGHLHSGTPRGKWEQIAGFETYAIGDNKAKTIVFICDVFGAALPNVQILADEYAQAGFYVLVPDLLEKDYIPLDLQKTIIPLSSDETPGLVDKTASSAKLGVTFPPWLVRNREANFKPKVQKFLETLRADSSIGKIGSVGYCFGARFSMLFAQKGEPFFDCVVGQHPSFVAVPDEVEALAYPTQVNVGDNDSMMGPDQAKQTKEILEKKGWECNIIPGADHGFSVRGDLNNDKERKMKETATENAIRWFHAHL